MLALEYSQVWGMPNVRQFCIAELERLRGLHPGMRLALAIRHTVPRWVEISVNALAQKSICDLDENVNRLLPFEAYRVITNMHQKINECRLILMFQYPPAIHGGTCRVNRNQEACGEVWHKLWSSKVAPRMVHPSMIWRDTLVDVQSYCQKLELKGMGQACQILTKDNLKNSKVWGREEELIKDAVEKLEKLTLASTIGELPSQEDSVDPSDVEMV